MQLQKRLTNYLSLVKPLEVSEKHQGKFFIVGDEPSKKDANKQHQIWRHLMESSLMREDILEFVPSGEVDKIEKYLEDHDVRPFFKE